MIDLRAVAMTQEELDRRAAKRVRVEEAQKRRYRRRAVSPDDAADIRFQYRDPRFKMTTTQLCEQYECSAPTIRAILNRTGAYIDPGFD